MQGVKLGLWTINEENDKETWPTNATNNWGGIHAGF